MPAGSVLVTLHPLPLAIEPRSQVDDPNASFYKVEKVILGERKNCVTWASGSSEGLLEVYKYTRLEQPGVEAVFLCRNPLCTNAKAQTPIPATTTVNVPYGASTEWCRIVVSGCDACNSVRVPQTRGWLSRQFGLAPQC